MVYLLNQVILYISCISFTESVILEQKINFFLYVINSFYNFFISQIIKKLFNMIKLLNKLIQLLCIDPYIISFSLTALSKHA